MSQHNESEVSSIELFKAFQLTEALNKVLLVNSKEKNNFGETTDAVYNLNQQFIAAKQYLERCKSIDLPESYQIQKIAKLLEVVKKQEEIISKLKSLKPLEENELDKQSFAEN